MKKDAINLILINFMLSYMYYKFPNTQLRVNF